jgi:hypothetical protein
VLQQAGVATNARTRICTFELDARGLVVARVEHGMDMSLDDAREAVQTTFALAGNRRLPVLVDLRGIRSQSREARDYLSSEVMAPMFAAVALLIASPVSQVVGNFFMRLRHQPLPTRLFLDEQQAVRWLLEGQP